MATVHYRVISLMSSPLEMSAAAGKKQYIHYTLFFLIFNCWALSTVRVLRRKNGRTLIPFNGNSLLFIILERYYNAAAALLSKDKKPSVVIIIPFVRLSVNCTLGITDSVNVWIFIIDGK